MSCPGAVSFFYNAVMNLAQAEAATDRSLDSRVTARQT